MRQASPLALAAALLACLFVVGTQAFLFPTSIPQQQRRFATTSAPRTITSSSSLRPVVGGMRLWADVADKAAAGGSEVTERVITVADSAITHLKDLRAKQGVEHLWLRMGVRSGGCSGMSYVLDVMKAEEVTAEDHVEKYEQHGFSCVVDPQSMLYLFGLQLDYKDALIGGGFQFANPNSAETCGCGKSFGI